MREAASKSWRAVVSRSCCNSTKPWRNKISACLGSLAARRSRTRCSKGSPMRGVAGGGPRVFSAVLELEPQRKLNVTLAAGRRAGHLAESPILPITVGYAELRCIGDVEAFCAELEPEPFGDANVLEKRKVEVPGGRTVIGLQAEVAAGQRSRRGYCAGVKPEIGAAANAGRAIGVLARHRVGPASVPNSLAAIRTKRVRHASAK